MTVIACHRAVQRIVLPRGIFSQEAKRTRHGDGFVIIPLFRPSSVSVLTRCFRHLSTTAGGAAIAANGGVATKLNPYIQGPETHFGFESVGIEEKEGRVKEVFESVADSYDVMNDLMSGGLHRYWKDQLLDISAVASMARAIRRLGEGQDPNCRNRHQLRILDVAGGTGDVAFRFVDAAGCPERARSSGVDPISVTVCDINPEMLRVGQKRAMERYGPALLQDGTKALSFVEGNAQDLVNFAANSFDLYTIAFGLRNVTDVVRIHDLL
jgi:2-methoxy-6-polyprenyl-1,4-benzoquinol methylase